MRVLLLFFSIGLAISFKAQITITEMNMPETDSAYVFANAINNAVDPELAGQNVLWDYSDLIPINFTEDIYNDIQSSEAIFQFVFNNGTLFPDYISDYFISAPGIDFDMISIEDISNFYKVSPQSYEQTGFGAVLNGFPTPIFYDPIDVIYELPMNYGDMSANPAYFEADIPTLGFWSRNIFRTNEVIGWGTLVLPDDSYEVLKVKTTINNTDSIYVDALNFGTSLDQPQTVEYKWLSAEENAELLTITEILGQVVSVRFRSDSTLLTSSHQIEPTAFKLFPNPSNGLVQIQSEESIQSVECLDAMGRLVDFHFDFNNQTIDLSQLPKGIYYIKLNMHAMRILLLD